MGFWSGLAALGKEAFLSKKAWGLPQEQEQEQGQGQGQGQPASTAGRVAQWAGLPPLQQIKQQINPTKPEFWEQGQQ
jgi:hypothetical protein